MTTSPAPRPLSGAVLAGGRARRMGADKRALDVDGTALLVRAVRAVAAVTGEVTVVTAEPAPTGLRSLLPATVRWRCDHRPGQGPVAGLEAALDPAAGPTTTPEPDDVVVVLAGDHPAAVPAVLDLLVTTLAQAPQADAAVLVTVDGPQPLVGAYRRRAGARVRRYLDAGGRRALGLLDHLEVVTVGPDRWTTLDPEARTAVDLDTPEDLAGFLGGTEAPADVGPAGEGPDADVTTRRDPDAGPQADPGWPRTVAVAVQRRGTVPHDLAPRDATAPTTATDPVAVEEPLELRVAGPGQVPVAVFTTLRTPGHDAELALGWLVGEGLLHPGDRASVSIGDAIELARPDDQVTVHLPRPFDPQELVARHAAATASCGVCGRATLTELTDRCAAVPAPSAPVSWAAIAAAMTELRAHQPLFAATGGVHAAATCQLPHASEPPHGNAPATQLPEPSPLEVVREDVGRHNALDMVVGWHQQRGSLPLTDRVVLLSGRAGFELIAKAAVAGAPVVAAVGAPTDLAVRTADALGVSLVAFLRDGRGNVYTHPDRLAAGP